MQLSPMCLNGQVSCMFCMKWASFFTFIARVILLVLPFTGTVQVLTKKNTSFNNDSWNEVFQFRWQHCKVVVMLHVYFWRLLLITKTCYWLSPWGIHKGTGVTALTCFCVVRVGYVLSNAILNRPRFLDLLWGDERPWEWDWYPIGKWRWQPEALSSSWIVQEDERASAWKYSNFRGK